MRRFTIFILLLAFASPLSAKEFRFSEFLGGKLTTVTATHNFPFWVTESKRDPLKIIAQLAPVKRSVKKAAIAAGHKDYKWSVVDYREAANKYAENKGCTLATSGEKIKRGTYAFKLTC